MRDTAGTGWNNCVGSAQIRDLVVVPDSENIVSHRIYFRRLRRLGQLLRLVNTRLPHPYLIFSFQEE